MRREGPQTLQAFAKYAEELGGKVDPKYLPPPLRWESEIYEWYGRLQSQVLTRSEVIPAGLVGVSSQVPCALDRNAWWPLIERQGWSHSVVMTLLDRIDQAAFGKLQIQDEEADGE